MLLQILHLKKAIITLVTFLIASTTIINGQEIFGQWNGKLKVQGKELRVVFNIRKSDNGFSSTMDSPDQGAYGIPVNSTSFENSTLKLEITSLGVQYHGTLNEENVFVGTFKQMGISFPMNLKKADLTREKIKRPQEQVKPYLYYSEDVKFENKKDNVVLAGTLTLPKKDGYFPSVILISGSGSQNRDEEVYGHKPFLVLADHLSNNGIGVLRYDDRGTANSTGNFSSASTYDLANDAEAAINYLKYRGETTRTPIGIIGHSEGAVIAMILASRNKEVDFIVLMAGSALRGDKLLLLQKKKIETQLGINKQLIESNQQIFAGAYEMIINRSSEPTFLRDSVFNYFRSQYGNSLPEQKLKELTGQLLSPWMLNFIRLDPSVYLEKITCPVFAINGDKDLQVPSKENLEIIKAKLTESGNTNFKVKEFVGLNHMFQECETGLPDEYAKIEQTISPMALEEISNWILKQVK